MVIKKLSLADLSEALTDDPDWSTVLGRGCDGKPMVHDTTISDTTDDSVERLGSGKPRTHFALVIAWCAYSPKRAGEVAFLASGRRGTSLILGRGEALAEDRAQRVVFKRYRPGVHEVGGPLDDRRISRSQLRFEVREGGQVTVENVGKRTLQVNGQVTDSASISPGDCLAVGKRLLLTCERRPYGLAPTTAIPRTVVKSFGAPDGFGMVGESPRAWALREQLGIAAEQRCHTLLLGPSGAGKELAAAMLHGLSNRSGKKMVSRNAATFPDALIDAELFGNVANYPNPGMRERPGLIGAAHGTTLFLDEVAELPESLQAHLLRVLDQGEYQRLGDKQARHSDFVLIAATNRDPSSLKHDLLARLALRITLPTLNDRRADIPLIVLHLLRDMALRTPSVKSRFFESSGSGREVPRVDIELIRRLITHQFTHHVRELDTILRTAVVGSSGNIISITDDVEPMLDVPEEGGATRHDEVSREQLLAALKENEWHQAKTWKALGLKNRYVLRRLLKKYDINPEQ